jgi:hypothetical protein
MLTRYTLMHRDAEVADIEMEDGYLTRITLVHEKQHAPIGTMNVVENLGVKELRFWLQRRLPLPHGRWLVLVRSSVLTGILQIPVTT